MLLHSLSECDIVEVIEVVDTLPKRIVVLVLYIDVVEGFVYCLVVVRLDALHVW